MAYESWQALIEHLDEIERLGPSNPRIYRGYLEPVPALFRNLVLFDDTLEDNNGRTRKGEGNGLAHYTSWENAVKILEHGADAAIRMYNYETANDPCEGIVPRKEWHEVDEQANLLDRRIEEKVGASVLDPKIQGSAYGCSFSSGPMKDVGDNLTSWRLYGNNGEGCSFLLPIKRGGMYRVRYYDSVGGNVDGSGGTLDRDVRELFGRVLGVAKKIVEKAPANQIPKINDLLVMNIRRLRTAYRHLAKNQYYQDEREWRMVRVAPASRDIRFDVTNNRLVRRYVRGPLWNDVLISRAVITIGPCVRNQAAAHAYVRERMNVLSRPAEVVVSRMEYRLV